MRDASDATYAGAVRIGIIGAGAVGGTLAALLDRAGHSVEVAARGAHLDAIRARGLELTGAWGSHTAHVIASTTLQHAPELAIVATKAQDAVAAVRPASKLLARVPVLIVQNGLVPLDTIRAELPGADVLGGLALFAASHLRAGDVHATAAGSLVIGGDLSDAGLGSLFAARALREVMPVSISRDFAGAQWTKLIVNQVNALPAITGLSAQEVIADPRLRHIMTASIREAVRVGIASGVHFESIEGLSHGLLRAIAAGPVALSQLVPLAMSRRMGAVPNPGSTLQSIRRGSPTEIDHLNGAIVRAGAASGTPAPINARMVELVHEVERTGEFFTADAVAARIRCA